VKKAVGDTFVAKGVWLKNIRTKKLYKMESYFLWQSLPVILWIMQLEQDSILSEIDTKGQIGPSLVLYFIKNP